MSSGVTAPSIASWFPLIILPVLLPTFHFVDIEYFRCIMVRSPRTCRCTRRLRYVRLTSVHRAPFHHIIPLMTDHPSIKICHILTIFRHHNLLWLGLCPRRVRECRSNPTCLTIGEYIRSNNRTACNIHQGEWSVLFCLSLIKCLIDCWNFILNMYNALISEFSVRLVFNQQVHWVCRVDRHRATFRPHQICT